MTDGSFITPKGYTRIHVSIGLQIRDREILDRFAEFLGGGVPVRIKTRSKDSGAYSRKPQVHVTFGCREVVADLMRYGMAPHKSFTAAFTGGMEFNRHAWRGAIDGDGSVALENRKPNGLPVIQFVGSKSMNEQFLDFVKSIAPKYRGTVAVRHYCSQPIYHSSVTGRSAKKLAEVLYGDCTVAIPRKLESARAIMAWQSQRREFCTVPDCLRKHLAKGMCSMHYTRAKDTTEKRRARHARVKCR